MPYPTLKSCIHSVPETHKSLGSSAGRAPAAAATPAPPTSTATYKRPKDKFQFNEDPYFPAGDDSHGPWDTEVQGHMSFTGVEDIENTYTNGGWGLWADKWHATQSEWESDKWSLRPEGKSLCIDVDDVDQEDEENSADIKSPQKPILQIDDKLSPLSPEQEDDPARYRFHAALHAAALRGDVDAVSRIFTDMYSAGLPPGPSALHCLVFAHVKAADAASALQAARAIVGTGMSPLEETYIALVYGLVEEDKVDLAEGVVMSMYNSGQDARGGWLALTKGLFRKSKTDDAFHHLQKGLQEGWNPDASLYQYVLQAFCTAGNLEQAQRVLESMRDLGVPPQTLHVNVLVEATARTAGLSAALEFIDNTFADLEQSREESSNDPIAVPNSETFCAVFRGMFDGSIHEMEEGESSEGYSQVTSAMMSAELTPGPKIMTWGLRWFLMDGDLESALEQVSSLRTVAGEAWTEHLEDSTILSLLHLCGEEGHPLDLAVLLRELHRRNRSFTRAVLPTEFDPTGRPVSSLTSWLPHRIAVSRMTSDSGLSNGIAASVLESADLDSYNGDIRTVTVNVKGTKTDVLIGIGGCAVTEGGEPIRLAAMLKVQLMAELEARGHSSEGKVADLRAKVRVQRAILEPRIAAWRTRQLAGGGDAMDRLQLLVAGGMSLGAAMHEVRETLDPATLALQGEMQGMGGLSGAPDAEEDDEEERIDEFGIELDTPVAITEYTNWNMVSKISTTYGDLSDDERKSYRMMHNYSTPDRHGQSSSVRRATELEGVMDEAEASMAQGSDWDGGSSATGLLGQFEGDLEDGTGNELSPSDGVGGPSSDGDDALETLINSGPADAEDDSDVIVGDDDLDTPSDDEISLSESEDELADDDETKGLHESEDEDSNLLEDEVETDAEEEEIEQEGALNLNGITNSSAGLEVAIECLRCARLVGIVISRGDFEVALSQAKVSKSSQQSRELIQDAQLSGPDAAAVTQFTADFSQKSCDALINLGHNDDAVRLEEEAKQVRQLTVGVA